MIIQDQNRQELVEPRMFNLFSKSKKPKSGKKKKTGKKKSVAAESAPQSRITTEIRPENLPEPDPSPPSVPDSTSVPISASDKLEQAKSALASGKFKGKLAPKDRKQLIEQALAIRQVQSKLLEDLDEDTRQRLRKLAVDKLFQGRK